MLHEHSGQHKPSSKQGKWGGRWLSMHRRLEMAAAAAAAVHGCSGSGSQGCGGVGGTLNAAHGGSGFNAARSGSWFVRWTRLHWRGLGGRWPRLLRHSWPQLSRRRRRGGSWLLSGWLGSLQQLNCRLCCRFRRRRGGRRCCLRQRRLGLRLYSFPCRLDRLHALGRLLRGRLRRWSPGTSGRLGRVLGAGELLRQAVIEQAVVEQAAGRRRRAQKAGPSSWAARRHCQRHKQPCSQAIRLPHCRSATWSLPTHPAELEPLIRTLLPSAHSGMRSDAADAWSSTHVSLPAVAQQQCGACLKTWGTWSLEGLVSPAAANAPCQTDCPHRLPSRPTTPHSPLPGCTSCTGSAPGSVCTSSARCTTSALPCGCVIQEQREHESGPARLRSSMIQEQWLGRQVHRQHNPAAVHNRSPRHTQLLQDASSHLAQRHHRHVLCSVDHGQGERDALSRGLGRVRHRQHPALCTTNGHGDWQGVSGRGEEDRAATGAIRMGSAAALSMARRPTARQRSTACTALSPPLMAAGATPSSSHPERGSTAWAHSASVTPRQQPSKAWQPSPGPTPHQSPTSGRGLLAVGEQRGDVAVGAHTQQHAVQYRPRVGSAGQHRGGQLQQLACGAEK